MSEQMVMAFDDPHQAAFDRFRETVDGGRFLDLVYRRAYVAMTEGRKIGLKRLVEDIRWDTKSHWNNNWTAPLGRWLIRKDARFGQVIETRKRNAVPSARQMLRGIHAAVERTGQEIIRGQEPQPFGWGRQGVG